MEEHETVLSEVHIGLPVCSTSTNVVSRFEFEVPAGLSLRIERNSEESSDSEDQEPPRRRQPPREVLFIEHNMATALSDVGLQVWPAALAMADFLLHEHEKFKESLLLEIGGGVGLCGLVASRVAKKIVCSDYKAEIVDAMKTNFLKNRGVVRDNFECLVLDVKDAEVVDCDFLFGSDLIYDDEITDNILNFVKRSLLKTTVAFFLSLEKRFNFTIDNLEESCPAYKHFRECCQRQCLQVENIDLEAVPQYFKSLPRSKHIEILEIRIQTPDP
ncbi:methyltransferase-like protein 22 [Galendromus occidentalis]|uniref:Methyltransferase-like protein 22 n=1 Tax=Galendromus occidentalis TaxID=34638 RepID=A0AAJ6VZY6_9ACAR|nr:methyltransferase-like protein 22 [Galendromus occidentalis]